MTKPALKLPRILTDESRAILLDPKSLAGLYAHRSIIDVARLLGTANTTVRAALEYHGIDIHPQGQPIPGPQDGETATISPPAKCRKLTRAQVRRAALRAYHRLDRCPPDCPGRLTCTDRTGVCTLEYLIHGR